MPIRIDENVMFSGTDATAAIELIDQSFATGSTELHVDVCRTDTYTVDGTFSRPYKILNDAILVANTNATVAKPYRVIIAPGIYNIDPFTINPYVKLEGAGWQTTVLKQNVPLTTNFITMSPGSVLRDVSLWGPTLANTATIHVGTSDPRGVAIAEVSISRGYLGILCDPGASRAPVIVQGLVFVYAGSNIDTLIRSTGFGDVFVTDAVIAGPADSVRVGIAADGVNAVCTVSTYYHEISGAATEGVFVDNGAMVRVTNSILSAGHAAFHAGSGNDSRIRVVGTTIHRTIGGGYTHDLLIDNATVTTTFTGFMSRDRITNLFNSVIYANFINHETDWEGACALGELIVGANAGVLPLLDYGRSAYLTGLVSGGEVTKGGGLIVNIATGVGYVNNGTDPVRVFWGNTHVDLPINTSVYIYMDRNGALQTSPTQPVYSTSIILGQAITNGTQVVVLTRDEISISHSISRIQEFFEDVIGPLTVSGCVASISATPLKITVGNGSFMVGVSERDVTGGADRPFYYVSQDGSGGWTYTASTVIDTEHYDSGSGPVDYPGADHFKKDAWYVVIDSSGETYYCVYGQVPYVDAPTAVLGALPSAPEILTHYGLRCAGIVSHKSDATLTSIQDVRPFLGQNSPITGATPIDHDFLLNRNLDNNHMQYLTTGRADTWHGLLAGAHVTNGNTHDHIGGDGAQIDHTGLSNIGTQTHVQLEATLNGHIADTANPHTVTKTQVSLGNVTDDAQLKRAAGDYSTFAPKVTAVNADVLVIEDSADGGIKKHITLDALPYPLAAAHGGTHTSAGPDAVPNAVAAGASGLMTGADKTKLDGITAGAAVSNVTGTAPVVSSGGTAPAISINPASGAEAGSMSSANFTKLAGITAGAAVSTVGGTAPIVSSGGTTPTISITAASGAAAGSMSAADFTKLSGIAAGATVASVSGTAPIVSSGGATPAISITAASGAAAGSMSASDFTKLSGIAAGATVNVFGNGYQAATNVGRVTYAIDTNFQTRTTLTTPALPSGTYRVSWMAILDGTQSNRDVEGQLYNLTDTAIVGVVQVVRPANTTTRSRVAGFAEIVFTGAAKTFQLQYRTTNTASTVGIADARIEIWRVA